MIEYVIVLLIVAVAAIYAASRLRRHIRGHGCEGCDCPEKNRQANRLVDIEMRRPRRR
jgi:hypothetical protein